MMKKNQETTRKTRKVKVKAKMLLFSKTVQKKDTLVIKQVRHLRKKNEKRIQLINLKLTKS